MRLAIILSMTLALAGCAASSAAQRADTGASVDTFCLQKRRTWEPDDSDETVRQARVFNETLERRCGRRAA